jgi:hypothetical protein
MALDEQVRHSAEVLASDIGRELQQRLGRLIESLLQDAAAERDALTARAAQFAAAADARLEAAVAEARAESRAEHEAALQRLREASDAERAAAVERVRNELADQSGATLATARQLAATELAAAVARAQQEAAAEMASAVQRAREEAASEATAAVDRARDEVAHASAQLQRQAEVERVAFERQRDEREAMLAEMERLVESFRRLDATVSLSTLLDALSDAAAQEAPRTALLIVKGRELQGWTFAGFRNAPADPRKHTIPLHMRPDFARAVDTLGRVEVSASQPDADAPSFPWLTPAGGDVGVAVPVIVGGNVGALLYADDGGEAARTVPASWPETLELLARHAARCLEAHTAMRAAGLGPAAMAASRGGAPAGGGQAADSQEEDAARRYARLVVSDILVAHEPEVRTGRQQRDLGERFRDQIDPAPEVHRQRVSAGLTSQDRLFEEESSGRSLTGTQRCPGAWRSLAVSQSGLPPERAGRPSNSRGSTVGA